MVFMGRVGLFTLYISDPTGQDFRRGGANLGGNPGCPGEQMVILAGQSFSERFSLPVVESGRKWVEVVESGRKWGQMGRGKSPPGPPWVVLCV